MILSTSNHQSVSLISGGQTGADRAALDFALDNGIPCGGWCPAGRRAEDGKISGRYPLKETSRPEYYIRTKKNVKEADATIIFFRNIMDRGTKLTEKYCLQLNKPLLKIDLTKPEESDIKGFFQNKTCSIINVAGPRESHSPGIYNNVYEFLEKLFGNKIR